MESRIFECTCKSYDHLMRVSFDKEDEYFYFEYKLCKFPKNEETNFFKKIKTYFKNILNSIKGNPNWFVAETLLDVKEIRKLNKFIEKKLKEINNE